MRSDERMQMTRRSFAAGAALSAAGLAASRDYIVYIGTYTNTPKSKGIYAWRSSGGKLTPLGLVAETPSPSFLALHPSGRYLYAVNEVAQSDGKKTGTVTAYSVSRTDGKLRQLNARNSGGPGPCYVSLDKTGRNVLVANYGGGSVAVLPVGADGQLQPASAFVQHQGSSVNERRQKEPHAHCIKTSPDNRYALASDLGADRLFVYRFDPKSGKITPNDPPAGILKPGSGPRHFAFHPQFPRVYAINELACSVTAFDWQADKGVLTETQTVSTLPDGASSPDYSTAEVIVHPNGRYLYGSNRGHDTIAIFAIGSGGALKPAGHVSTKGSTPRNFAIDPSGTRLFAANQKSDTVVVFDLDPSTGALTPTGDVLEAGSPVCVRFLSL